MNKVDVSIKKLIYIIVIISLFIWFDKNYGSKHEEEQMTKKEELINDLFPYGYDHHDDDITNFVFITKDLYYYNPQSYQEMIDNIVAIIDIYDKLLIYDEACEQQYEKMTDKKHNAVNNLHSIIYSMPNSDNYTDKLENAIVELDTILAGYIDKTRELCRKKIRDNGYNINRKMIHNPKHPKAKNAYLDTDGWTFDVY